MADAAQSSHDPPVEVLGYVTDEKLVGFQVLTNYESHFWRALVGRDAWSLYEVLRSFCHKGNDTCDPSIKTLMAILGLTDRRQLIGRVDSKPGKERELPGLIDMLQDFKLAFAEVKGEGPTLRYVFHVTLTPPGLTPEQVKILPEPLQKKHAQLLQRIANDIEELKNIGERNLKQRKILPAADTEKGSGTIPPPPGMVPPPPGTVPPKQQPVNKNHETTLSKSRRINNNSSGEHDPKSDVVVALTEKGISQKVAQRLASRYKATRIFEKIEFLAFLQETTPAQVKNAAGWLRRAIEEDFAKPAGFLSAADREAQAKERERQQQENARLEAAQMAQEARNRERQEKLRSDHLETLKSQYNTSEREENVWLEIVTRLEATDPTKAKTYLAGSQLVALTEGHAVLWFPHHFAGSEAERHFSLAIKRLLAKHLHVSVDAVTLTFVAPDKADENGP